MPLPHKKNFLRDVLPKNQDIQNRDVSNRVPLNIVRNKPPVAQPEPVVEDDVVEEPIDNSEDKVVYHSFSDQVIEVKDNPSRFRIWILAFLAIIILAVTISYVFASAKVYIVPRVEESSFDQDFKVKKNSVADAKVGELGFMEAYIEETVSKEVDSDGQKEVTKKASGTIIVYNSFSENTQKLVRNTRFESPEGLIYRIDKTIVVPGRKTVDGKIVPGSIEVVVYADEPGVKYNIGLTDFTIPGFKSDSGRFKGFYARSKTPMLDGFSGMARYVSDTKQKTVRIEMRTELEKKIMAKASSAVSEGYFIPKGAYVIEYESLPNANSTGSKVSLVEKAKLYVYGFKKEEWDNFLAKNTSFKSIVASSTLQIKNREDLNLKWITRPKPDSLEISFRVEGRASFVWQIDEEKLLADFVGKKKNDAPSIIQKYGSISSAEMSFYPPWSSKFPKDIKKIKLIYNNATE